jgi:hypothetical protein
MIESRNRVLNLITSVLGRDLCSAGPSFTAADWLNQPIEVFSFDVASPNGTTLWQFE